LSIIRFLIYFQIVYLTYSQIWLSRLLNDYQCTFFTKFKKEKPFPSTCLSIHHTLLKKVILLFTSTFLFIGWVVAQVLFIYFPMGHYDWHITQKKLKPKKIPQITIFMWGRECFPFDSVTCEKVRTFGQRIWDKERCY